MSAVDYMISQYEAGKIFATSQLSTVKFGYKKDDRTNQLTKNGQWGRDGALLRIKFFAQIGESEMGPYGDQEKFKFKVRLTKNSLDFFLTLIQLNRVEKIKQIRFRMNAEVPIMSIDIPKDL